MNLAIAVLNAWLWHAEHAPMPRSSATPVHVVLYNGRGVSQAGFEPALAAFEADPRFDAQVLSASELREQPLPIPGVVVFMGGSGTRQGQALGEQGRERVREFVRRGGGYVGVCGGAYLALQGEDRFFKLRLVAARNATGDAYLRGIAGLPIRFDEYSTVPLHYANGPVFAPVPDVTLPPFTPLATFASDLFLERYGTKPGDMPGTPAIIAAVYGSGRVLLFSPNPAMGPPGDPHPELLLESALWASEAGPIAPGLGPDDVFGKLVSPASSPPKPRLPAQL